MQTRLSPPATRQEPVEETLHGITIADPYRWLENAGSPETRQWVQAQNAHTRAVLDAVPGRETIHDQLASYLAIGVVGAPRVRARRAFYMRRDGDQNQPILLMREGDNESVLVDPNARSDTGLVTLDWWEPSSDGRLIAYGMSENGDEWSTLRVYDVDAHADLPDRIERTRYASIAWLPDASGFYYTRYPSPGDVPKDEENYGRKVFFHQLGGDSSDDAYVYGDGLNRESTVGCDISPDGRWLLMSIHQGWERNDLYLLDRADPDGHIQPFVVGYDALFSIEFANHSLYIHTNLDAPKFRLLSAGPDQLSVDAWQEILPESADSVLNSVTASGGKLLAHYGRNAMSELVIVDANGARLEEVELPALGTVTAVTGTWDDPDAYFAFESFVLAPTVYQLADGAGLPKVWAQVASAVDANAYEVQQEWYRSTDGTSVSMFIVHRRDLDRSIPQPTVLTGYGGFNIGRTPAFSRPTLFWLEQGGIYALPNLRGGNEYGEDWHRAGMREHKQNVFDDFITAAEHLIDHGYTDRHHLCIAGGSNGGLLVGAALTQRPDLFRAVVCRVPLLDMLRYHVFLIARLWVPEYGSAEDADQFQYLYAYSPYHRVQTGTEYPALLLMTAESDTRVDPLHARKMAALMQAANASSHPILLRVESRAGHGVGKPLAKLVEDETDLWTFVCRELDVSV